MSLIYFLLWLIFNGRITTEIIITGLVISILLDLFIRKVIGLNLNLSGLLKFFRILPEALVYFAVLVIEIIHANISISKLVTVPNIDVEPCLIKFRSKLKTEAARVVFANSITLTPGTITISLEGDEYLIHTLNKNLAEGLDNGKNIFERILAGMERKFLQNA